MKKSTIYLILLLCLSLTVPQDIIAQNEPGELNSDKGFAVGIRFGAMTSDLWFPNRRNIPSKTHEPVEPLKSFTFGISIAKDLSTNIWIDADIMYQRKGRGVFPVIKDITIGVFCPNVYDPIGLNYLSVSGFFLLKTNWKVSLYGGPGIYNSVLLNSYIIIDDPFRFSFEKLPSDVEVRGYDLGMGMKAGVLYPISQRIQANICIAATTGLITVFKSKDWQERCGLWTTTLNKTLSGNVTLSYRF